MADQSNKPEVPELKPVANGTVVEDSIVKKAAKMLLSDDIDSITGSIAEEYIKPKIKQAAKETKKNFQQLIIDTANNILQAIFFGKTNGNGSTGYYNGSKVNYVKYYSGDQNSYSNGTVNGNGGAANAVKKVKLDSYGEAEQVLTEIISILKRRGKLSIAEYYQAAGVNPSSVDYNWGWYDLIDTKPVYDTRIDGWILSLPRAVPIV